MSTSSPNVLSAKDFHDARAEITNQGVRGLILINGGGSVALLAFLQAIWSEQPELAKYVVVALGVLALGVFLAGFVSFLRYHTSFSFQSGNQRSFKFFRTLSFTVQYASLICFGLGMLIVLSGAWGLLGQAVIQ